MRRPDLPTPATRAVAAPPRIEALVRSLPDGPLPVVHASAAAVYWRLPADRPDGPPGVIGLSAPGAVGLPICLRAADSPARGSSGGASSAYVVGGTLHWEEHVLVTGRFVEVRAPRLDLQRSPTLKTDPARAVAVPHPRSAGFVAPTLPPRVDADTVAGLVGLGDGLTPQGDDVLCGWLAAHPAAGVPTPAVDAAVRAALPRTTPLSAALLSAALLGEVCDPVAGYLRALATPHERAARAALLRVGSSSGAGLAHGLDLALGPLLEQAAA